MAVVLAMLGFMSGVTVVVLLVVTVIAYIEGRDDATQIYPYRNPYWWPASYFYEVGYSKWEGKERLTLTKRNKKRYNRE